jgi:DNA-binding XRE family transcriptional regulator
MPLPFRSLCAKLRTAIKPFGNESWSTLGKAAARVKAGSPVNATDFLRLCARLDIDPLTGGAARETEAALGDLSFELLGAAAAIHRHLEQMSQRDVAARSGLSLTTIVRIEQGHTVSAQSVLAICKFMNVDPFHYMGRRREAA